MLLIKIAPVEKQISYKAEVNITVFFFQLLFKSSWLISYPIYIYLLALPEPDKTTIFCWSVKDFYVIGDRQF